MKHAKLLTASVLALGLYQGANAADTAQNASVKWNAEVIKKTDVDLNVFANSENLNFTWDPTNKTFTTATTGLTIQMGHKTSTDSYKLTAQLGSRTLTHIAGGSKGSFKLAASLGGMPIADEKPVTILAGNSAGGVTTAAGGMGHMDISKAGAYTTTNGSYHEARNMDLRFHVDSAANSKGEALANLSNAEEGTYKGTVEMVFNASWKEKVVSGD